MSTCTFFGHRECPSEIRGRIQEAVVHLIVEHGVNMFYVGNQGQFDALVRSVLRELKTAYPNQFEYAVVLAYMPEKKKGEYNNYSDTMLPEGIEKVTKRFAISWRNQWMINRSDYVVTYVTHSWGGAAQFSKKASKMGKGIISL